MSDEMDQKVNGSENGLEEGLGASNTQPGPPVSHPGEPDALEYGLGSPETQGEEQGAFDHTKDAADSGLPVGLGSHNSQAGPAVPHPYSPNPTEHGLGDADTQHEER
jgi:hypothetical protein